MEEPVATPIPPRPRKVERSCILCHRRKIRCDKRSPCSTCLRTGVLCCYPTAGQPARRPRKTTISDVAERLGRLERTLVAISSGDSINGSPTVRSASLEPDQVDDVDNSDTEVASASGEMLLQSGDSNRYYINDVLFSHVLDEEQKIKFAMGVKDYRNDGPDSPPQLEPFNLVGVLSGPSPLLLSTQDLQPSKRQAMQLWQVFVNNVEPFSKVLHLPTAQIGIFKAIEHPHEASGEANCLLFAIYFAAITSISADDVTNILGWDKMNAISACKRGLEISLAQANFLAEPTFISLQAMCIFLQIVRAHSTGRSIWILAGLVVRAAQSLGLHRDGKRLNLPPFEAEMRRRVWWGIASLDIRAAEDHGIAVTSIDSCSNIKLPLNVDDSQLHPTMTELPESQARWTEMTFPLMLHEQGIARYQLYRMLPPLGNTVPSEAARREVVEAMQASVEEKYLRYHNPAIPVQRLSAVIGRVVSAKLDLVSKLQWLTVGNKKGIHGLEPNEEMLVSACQILEYGIQAREDEILRSYRWAVEIYPQYHTLLYVLWHLCVRPEGPSVERAWSAVHTSFDHEFMTRTVGNSNMRGCKWAALRMLKDKALRIRASGEKRGSMTDKEGGDDVRSAADKVGWSNQPLPDSTMGASENSINWAMDGTEPPDWHALVDDFGMDGELTTFLD